jgi:hypothetical protein
MKKLITFCLWGDNPKYYIGAIKNAELAPKIYPEWTCRFYVGNTIGDDIITELGKLGAEVLIHVTPGDWRGMFWRFEPASEDDVDAFISRDCDSRLNEREAAAVKEWMDGPHLVHSMGDHLFHFNPSQALMGGMFGMKKYACPNMIELINQFKDRYPDAWQCDQDFLRDYIWPIVRYKVLAHSDFHPRCQPFPIKRNGLEFIGEIFDENDQPNLEHREILRKLIG